MRMARARARLAPNRRSIILQLLYVSPFGLLKAVHQRLCASLLSRFGRLIPTVLCALTFVGAGCSSLNQKPLTTLDLSPSYARAPSGSFARAAEHHHYGVSSRLQHHDGEGLVAGLGFAFMQGRRLSATAVLDSTYALGSVTPYVGFDAGFLSMDIGMNLYLGGNSRELRLLPIPYVTFRIGDLREWYFEVVTGPERGALDGTIAIIGLGGRWGERDEFHLRGGFAVTLTPTVDSGFDGSTSFEFIEPENAPVGAVLEFTWVGGDGVGLFSRVVAAEAPTVSLGLAFDLQHLTGASE